MNNQYNVWNKWDPLKTVMLGDCYGPNFFNDIKNTKISSALTQIAEETKEDLEYFEKILKDFGCNVLRPKLDNNDSILNYIDPTGKITGNQGVPRAPLQPRDAQVVIGNQLFYTTPDHISIKECLTEYNNNFQIISTPLTEQKFNDYRGNNAPSWPTYEQYVDRCINNQSISNIGEVVEEFIQIENTESINNTGKIPFPVASPNITVVGKDIYIDVCDISSDKISKKVADYCLKSFKNIFLDFRINTLNVGGHNDSCFHTIKPGSLLSLHEIQNYSNTFPDWDVCYLPDQSWEKVKGFLKIKKQVAGKWWLPEQEDNVEFTNFVETWLTDWVGYVEETVFDVNVLVLDEHHVCVNNMNPTVINFLKKHNMEPVHVPWRHRYFWDGGLHCITLDLYREGKQQDYFPDRPKTITDWGF